MNIDDYLCMIIAHNFGHKLGTFNRFLGTFWDHLGTLKGYKRQYISANNILIYKGF